MKGKPHYFEVQCVSCTQTFWRDGKPQPRPELCPLCHENSPDATFWLVGVWLTGDGEEYDVLGTLEAGETRCDNCARPLGSSGRCVCKKSNRENLMAKKRRKGDKLDLREGLKLDAQFNPGDLILDEDDSVRIVARCKSCNKLRASKHFGTTQDCSMCKAHQTVEFPTLGGKR